MNMKTENQIIKPKLPEMKTNSLYEYRKHDVRLAETTTSTGGDTTTTCSTVLTTTHFNRK
jgi:hypothetical protein